MRYLWLFGCRVSVIIIGTAKYFTARRSIYGWSWDFLPQNSYKRGGNTKQYCSRNNLLASRNTYTGSYRNNLLSLSIQYLLRECDILVSGNSLNNPMAALRVQDSARILYKLHFAMEPG
jgi:hypothetical protein